ncbi:MAG: PDDEXK nuclease domain-containing protein [Bacteroidota bacterium]
MSFDPSFLKDLKQTILQSRYRAAQLANRELLGLYFQVGNMISERTQAEAWGSKVLNQISAQLQQELPGLRGFSASNLKKMRLFFEAWSPYLVIGSPVANQLESRPEMLPAAFRETFLMVSFTHHQLILSKTQTIAERIYYVQQVAQNFWSKRTLEHHLKSRLYETSGKLPNNFQATLGPEQAEKAIRAFKDSYLLDFLNLEDPEDEDERVLEQELVRNVQKFLQSLGPHFAFVGNQYRLIVEEQEFFVDLVFFHRGLQCLIAFELKRGKFKPEYVGQMNFYFSALDDVVRQPHENPSIGIILCREKKNKIVEYAIRDLNQSMGVATFHTLQDMPPTYQEHLPSPEDLKRLLE